MVAHLLFWGDLMKKKIIVACICAVVVLVLSIGIYWHCHPTHYKFNDRFIIGNTEEKIIEKYGEFVYTKNDENGELIYGEYVASDYNVPNYILGFSRKWFVVEFENGIATETSIREGEYIQ